MNINSYILNDFFEILNDINANYCVMNNYENMPEIIPSDVDFAVDLQTYHMLDSLVMQLSEKHKVSITQKIWHGYNKCAYILSPLEIDSYFWLQLDFFVDFSGRGFPNLLPNSIMLSGKQKYKNFFVPTSEVEVPFLLQRRIFKGDIEEKHIAILVKLYKNNMEVVKKGIVHVFGKNTGGSLIKFIESANIDNFKRNYPQYRKRLKEVSSKHTDMVYRIKYVAWQFIRAMYRFYYPTGLSIVFIGKDTSLKRDFIKIFNENISGSFHGTLQLTPKSKSKSDYLKLLLKDYWAKVTKRKTLWNLDTTVCNWKNFFLKRNFVPSSDVIICIYDQSDTHKDDIGINSFILSEDRNQNEEIMKQCIYIVLETQAKRTKRHLMDKVSPTARLKV